MTAAINPEIVERAARQAVQFLVDADGSTTRWEDASPDMQEEMRKFARSMFTAALGDHSVIVPREPTQEMLDAALALDEVSKGVLVPASPADAYAAMISAAHDKGE